MLGKKYPGYGTIFKSKKIVLCKLAVELGFKVSADDKVIELREKEKKSPNLK